MINVKQRLPFSKKNKEWRKNNVDMLCREADRFFKDGGAIQKNYDLKNSQLDQEEYRDLCDTLNVDSFEGKIILNKLNLTPNIIETLKGEEINRSFKFHVSNNSQETVNEVLRERDLAFKDYLDSLEKKSIERATMMNDLNAKFENDEMKEAKFSKYVEQVNSMLDKKFEYDLDPVRFKEKVNNVTTTKERKMNKLLRIQFKNLKIKVLKNKTFEDVLIGAREMVELFIEREGQLPQVRELNVLNTFYSKSNGQEFVQDGEYAGYVETISHSQLMSMYGDAISSKDLKDLENVRHRDYVHGVTSSRYGKSDKKNWHDEIKKKIYPTGSDAMPGSRFIDSDGQEKGVPHYAGGSSQFAHNKGLYADNSDNDSQYNNQCLLYTVYWVSERKVAFYRYINEYGKMELEIVDEDFIVPEDAKEEVYDEDMFAGKKKRFVWYRGEEQTFHSVEFKWIPEVWKGKRVNGDIYFGIEPLQHGYKSLLNPYKVKLPIYGKVYNNRNSYPVSIMDRMAPWQKIYYAVSTKMIRMLVKDQGVITFLNTLMIDEKIGWQKTLKLAERSGFAPYNPFSKNQGTNFVNTLKVAETIDTTNSGAVQYYIMLLDFIEEKIKTSAGMSDQRMAQTKQYSTATDNQRDVLHSMNITESLFREHDLLWESIMQGLLEMTSSVVAGNTGILRGYLSNDEIALISVDDINLEDDFFVEITDSQRSMDILESNYQMLHAMVQNDKLDFLSLIELMEYDDISDFKQHLRKIQKENEDTEKQMQEQQSKADQDAQMLQIERIEDEQKAKLDEIYLKERLKYDTEMMKAKLTAMSFDPDKDHNNDGIADYLQIEQLNQKIANDTMKIELEREKNNMKREEMGNKRQAEQQKMSQDREMKSKDLALKKKQISNANKNKK